MSKIEKIKAKLAALLIDVKMGAVKTDKAVLNWESAEDLKVGDNVYVAPAEEGGERTTPADGEYKTEDGKVITVKDGAVESIVEVENEEELADENIDDTNENPAENPVEEDKVDDKQEEPVEAEDRDEEIAKIREEINELYKLIDSVMEKIGESRREADERFSKIEKMSQTVTITEQFENIANKKTGDAKVDKFFERFGNK